MSKKTITPGSAGTVESRELSTRRMGCGGEGKPERVILDGRIMFYVGIGWVDERPATQEDAEAFPVVIYPESRVEHQIAS